MTKLIETTTTTTTSTTTSTSTHNNSSNSNSQEVVCSYPTSVTKSLMTIDPKGLPTLSSPYEPVSRILPIEQQSLLSQSLITELNGLFDMTFDQVMMFYKPMRYRSKSAHVDIMSSDKTSWATAALNWIYQPNTQLTPTSQMLWYNIPPAEIIPPTQSLNPAGYYYYWLIDKLNEPFFQADMIPGPLYLTRTNLPHSIRGNEFPRWCISLRSKELATRPWHTTVEDFRQRKLI